ncbi:hypothetical protein CA54_59640 [Symmachiella macrocystis]|uniref:Uncharacterized protein n=1 Tax=Symmachiella macrocystis TaxID=2527985 RepID=A0A5C6B213_9PLAN|nr:hypothetical protein CA54_59640 [Symmachiella macrocystis]
MRYYRPPVGITTRAINSTACSQFPNAQRVELAHELPQILLKGRVWKTWGNNMHGIAAIYKLFNSPMPTASCVTST